MKHYYFLFFLLLTSIFAFSQDGCIDLEACNYNETATEDDGSCTYANTCLYSAGTWVNQNVTALGGTGAPTLVASGGNWLLTESTWISTEGGEGEINTVVYTGGELISECYEGDVTLTFVYLMLGGYPNGDINFTMSNTEGEEIYSSTSPGIGGIDMDSASLTGSIGATLVDVEGCETCSGETDGSGTIIVNDDDGDGICNGDEIAGCTDNSDDETPIACNYNPEATDDDGSCEYETCAGCTLDPGACNYNEEATIVIDCEYETCAGCMDLNGCDYDENNTIPSTCIYPSETYLDCDDNCINDEDGDGICNELEVVGCTDATACNYDETATDDGSCEYETCSGCTDALACNYDDFATIDDGSCYNNDLGCGCDQPAADSGYDCDGICLTDTDGDGVCDEFEIIGCTFNDAACNYNPDATDIVDCEYVTCAGCTDPEACSYDETATLDDGSCEYVPEGESCEGGCLDDYTPLTLEWTGAIGGESSFSVTGNEDVLLPLMVFPTDNGTMTQCWMTSLQADCFIIELEGPDELAWNLFTPLSESTPLLSGTNQDMTWGPQCIEGCMLDMACNYNPDAVISTPETCEFIDCAGCMAADACNYDPEAINDIASLPNIEDNSYYSINDNSNTFQYPTIDSKNLENGKLYAWQLVRTYESTLGTEELFSDIYVFKVFDSYNQTLDNLEIIKLLIGEQKYNELFNQGGSLSGYNQIDDSIKLNGIEISMSELNQIITQIKSGNLNIESIIVE